MSEQERDIRLDPDWLAALNEEFAQPYMQSLRDFLREEKQAGLTVYPPGGEIFAALNATPLPRVRVVILGQDPYHGPGQAHGLCFSVRKGQRPPPSLQNIFTELRRDIGLPTPSHGELTAWAGQGVLLLNSVLTVRAGEAASHQGRGWERFTDRVISVLNEQREGLVFLLWGGYAQRKGRIIDSRRHHVLTAAHPSPLAANRGGWFGCRHFSQANAWLASRGEAPIDWSLPD
ncbi:MAG: uracil-DNA glycosylase [Perlucidibaca sp.]